AFDTPTPTTTVGRRNRSNVPAQSLMLLNDPFIHAEAARWADRMLEIVADPSERLDAMVRCAIARPIREAEIEPMRAFLVDEAGERDWTDDPAAWTALAHVIFNLKEFALRR
ncbi:MAG: DUF1553 domain-containing protein, partial [Phycisphaerales bacterium]|nr:DUF1553 domain-containing protein [Phycisphaerales bacterium]